MNEEYYSNIVSLVVLDSIQVEDNEKFCFSLYINRKYQRLTKFFESIPDKRVTNKMKYWYLMSLFKLNKMKETEFYLAKIENLNEQPRILYIKGLFALKELDFSNSIGLLKRSFLLDPHFYDPLHKLIQHHLINESEFFNLLDNCDCSDHIKDYIQDYNSIIWLLDGDIKTAFNNILPMMKDSPSQRVLTIYISCCLALNKKQELFYIAQKLLETSSDSYLASFAAGCHLILMKRCDTARSLLWMTQRQAPSFAPAWLAYAYSYSVSNTNEPRFALSIIHIATRAFPKLDILHLWAGNYCVQLGNWKMALAHFAHCAPSGYVFNEIGAILLMNGRVQEALKSFQNAIVQKDVCTAFKLNAANVYRRTYQFLDAKAIYYEILDEEPENTHALGGLAFTLHLEGDYKSAANLYFKALTIDRNNVFYRNMYDQVVLTLSQEKFNLLDDTLFEEMFADYKKINNL